MFASNEDIIKAGLDLESVQKDCLYYTNEGIFFIPEKFPLNIESVRHLSPLPVQDNNKSMSHRFANSKAVTVNGGQVVHTKHKIVRQITFQVLHKETMENNPSSWLIAMASQCESMYKNPPAGMTCKNKTDYRNRWTEKLKYYMN